MAPPIMAAASGDSFSVVVDDHGRVTAWGASDSMKLGVPDAPAPKGTPANPVLPTPVTDVACGPEHSLAITADGHVLTWGSALGGRLGRAAVMDIAPLPPAPVAHNVRDIIAVAGGQNHSLALDDSGGVWGWGRDNRGQLTGTAGKGSPYPLRLPTAVPFTGIAAGREFTLALDADGTVWSWGRNDRGQLGLAGPPARSGAGKVALPGPALRIFAGQSHAGAVLADGSLFLWGAAHHGQLGIPPAPRAFSPQPVPMSLPGGAAVADAGGGDGYTVCLTEEGKVFTWGKAFHAIDGSATRGSDAHLAVPLAGQPR